MPRDITRRQQRYLFSSVSPLSDGQKRNLASEMRTGKVHLRRSGGKRTLKRRSRRT